MPAATTTPTDPSTPFADFEAITKFFVDQTMATVKQGEAVLTAARKQSLANIQQVQEMALEGIEKARGLAADMLPPVPEWVSTSAVAGTFAAGFDVIEQVVAAERKIVSSLITPLKAAS
jgi:hypothetical protein